MKKSMKILKIVPLMLLLVFSLSGCVSLQDLKDEHAVWKDDSRKTILWQGKEYQYLTNSEQTDFYMDGQDSLDAKILSVTESDVPTLLKNRLGDFCIASEDGSLLSVYSEVFCLTEDYDELNARVNEGSKMYCYAYKYDELHEYAQYYSTKSKFRTFTEEEKILFEKIEKNSIKKTGYDDWESNIFIAEMYRVSEDGLFRKYEDTDLCRTEKGEYFIEKYEEDDYYTYAVAKEDVKNIEKLFADAIKAAEECAEHYVE